MTDTTLRRILASQVPRWGATTPAAPRDLRRWQLETAWSVVERLAETNPFYGARLADLPTDRSAESFERLPRTTKSDVVDDCEAFPPYGSRSTCRPELVRHIVETSGTSGEGRETYVLDEDDEVQVFRAEALGFWWAGVRPDSTVLLTLPIGMAAAGLWYYGGLRLIGANVLSVGTYPTERKVAALDRYRADVVVGTPGYLQRLAVVCRETGVDPASRGVQALVVAGEPYSLEWAARIQQTWNATLFEQYGCTERAMAWACPEGVVGEGGLGVLHFPPELAYVEVIDPATGTACTDGDEGEIIVTPLYASASPLVRFATRDKVEYVAPGSCRCGRPLAGVRAGGIQRFDDMIKVRGLNVWPAHFDTAVFGVQGVTDYRGTVRRTANGADCIELTVERDEGRAPDVIADLVVAAVRRAVGLRVSVTAVDYGTISKSVPEGFVKVSRWRDLRSTPPSDLEASPTTQGAVSR